LLLLILQIPFLPFPKRLSPAALAAEEGKDDERELIVELFATLLLLLVLLLLVVLVALVVLVVLVALTTIPPPLPLPCDIAPIKRPDLGLLDF